MEMNKIYEKLGIEQLDEEKQTEIKQYLDETIDLKAKEKADEKVEEEKEKLVEQYENKFNEYKEDITSKFSDFVDNIMESELQIPEKVQEYARLGERYQPILEKLKVMMGIDEGQFDEEAKEIIKESRDELQKMKDKINNLTSENMELKKDAEEMAAHIYLRNKCDGLTESKKERVIRLLEDVTSKDEIDRKFDLVVEGYKDDNINEKTMYCKDCDQEVELDEENDETTCPECGGTLIEKKGKTNEELETEDKRNKTVHENNGNDIKSVWLRMIKENTY
ncbi:MAG: hypothetical protein ACOCRX_09165 [Candidatus Woesearchaeota archaeon]